IVEYHGTATTSSNHNRVRLLVRDVRQCVGVSTKVKAELGVKESWVRVVLGDDYSGQIRPDTVNLCETEKNSISPRIYETGKKGNKNAPKRNTNHYIISPLSCNAQTQQTKTTKKIKPTQTHNQTKSTNLQ